MNVNAVNVIGRLTADPELTKAGDHDLADMRVAVNRGQDRPAMFINVKAFDRDGANAAQYLVKGSLVGVTGRLHQDQWTNDAGEPRSSRHYIVADRIDYLDHRLAPAAPPAAEVEAVGL